MGHCHEEILNGFRFFGDNGEGEEEDEKIYHRRCRKKCEYVFWAFWALTGIKKYSI